MSVKWYLNNFSVKFVFCKEEIGFFYWCWRRVYVGEFFCIGFRERFDVCGELVYVVEDEFVVLFFYVSKVFFY